MTSRATAGVSYGSAVLAASVIPAVSLAVALIWPQAWHWFLIPVTVCGVLVGVDAFEWVRSRRDVFEPRILLGVFGLHFYYLAPILHVLLDYWPPLLSTTEAPWPSAVGLMAVLNAAGLVIYRAMLVAPLRPVTGPSRLTLREPRFQQLGVVAVVVSALTFVAVVVLFDGPAGFLYATTEDHEALAGTGWLLMIGAVFPFLAFCLVTVRLRVALRRHGALVITLLAGLVCAQLLVGGLRGSRAGVLWPMVFGLVVVHLVVAPISRRMFVACGLTVLTFLYAYGLYKGAGTDVTAILSGERTVDDVSTRTGRGVSMLLLGDLGRAEMQALVLDRQRSSRRRWSYGSTYAAAPLWPVPRSWLPVRPRDKNEVGTDLLYGDGRYAAGLRAQRVYGLAGEAILNAGPVGGVLSFVLLGWYVRFAQRLYLHARASAALGTKLLAMPVCALTVIVVIADLDNVVTFLTTQYLPLALVVVGASTWTRHGRVPSFSTGGPMAARTLMAERSRGE